MIMKSFGFMWLFSWWCSFPI